jgi:phosphoenolpyruvate carboxylase
MKNNSELLYHTYNSLFLRLDFDKIAEYGTKLALFSQHVEDGLKHGINPLELVHSFWDEYCENQTDTERINLLKYFIRYVERQVVLFDSVEDALFEQSHDVNGAGSLNYMLNRLNTPELRQRMLEKLKDFSLRLVLTAHPTQFYPGKVLGIIDDLGKVIQGNDLEEIRSLLEQLGKTSFVNDKKPTPYDEALSLSWFMENVFYHTIPDIIYRLLTALGEDAIQFKHQGILALGFWPGGDRDGNPFVTYDMTQKVARRLREGSIRCYYRDIRQLKRRLTFKGVEERIASIEGRIYATLYMPGNPTVYSTSEELLSDLVAVRRTLKEVHASLFIDRLDRFIIKVKIFGFHFASLDIRQDSRKHGEVWEAIFQQRKQSYLNANNLERLTLLSQFDVPLDEGLFPEDSLTYDTIATLRRIQNIQRENGSLSCHRYIISNCGSVLNVLEVLTLARQSMQRSHNGTVPLDIIPLFETVEDLAAGSEIMRDLYHHPVYAAHLRARGNQQTIMLGFSDGTKDGGYLRANWSIYRAKQALTNISRAYGISVAFFDGRGGPPGRGGGNNASYYAAHGPDIENREIQVTIQGQTVSSTYGTIPAARYNIERLFTAGLENHLFETHANELSEEDHQLLDDLAEKAYEVYLGLKKHPSFVPYLEKRTPLKWYGDTNIASRPTKRSGSDGLKFEDLRAIPFVGAWAQMKQNVPGYYGFGGALEAFEQAGKGKELRDVFKRSLFFRTLVENSMQSLSKSNFDATRYLADDPEFSAFWEMLHQEWATTGRTLLALSQQEHLLSSNEHSRRSIALREQIVLPLIAIQQFALQKMQDEHLSDSEREVFRRMVLRAMYGIINAARNAA